MSNNSNSNVIVVCIGNSFKTKCFTTSNSTTAKAVSPTPSTTSMSPNLSSSTPNHFTYKTTSTTNNKLNHNVVNNSENNGSRINCQMNNLLEEDEDEIESEKIDVGEKEPQPNGTHLSAEIFYENDQNQTQNENLKEAPQNLLINRVNGLKTETCI
jgi:hypothetical protein